MKNTLLKYWGYNTFRPLQEDIIQNVLNKKDTLALLPTGGGKSLCYQLPTLMNEGICLVITPLIALMKDQVESLKRKDIKAFAIHNGIFPEQINVILNNCITNNVKFLYISPERLKSELFIENLKLMNVSLIAVDEAHCISEWGYDFRPSYRNIISIRKILPECPIIALTASANKRVQEDIVEQLQLKNNTIFSQSFERRNLSFSVLFEEDKQGRLLRILQKVNGSGIIYARNRKKTKEIAAFLIKNNISADFYHAGLEISVRNKKQDEWMQGKKRIIVATNAFGMGIDKSDVRFVIHIDLPETLEAYYQEAGRAGRDGKKSYAIILWENNDLINLNESFKLSYPDLDIIKNVYHALGNYLQLPVGSGKNISFDFDIIQFSNNYNFNHIVVYNSLRFLERSGYLSIPEHDELYGLLYIQISKEDLYRFQVENEKYDSFIKNIMRLYGGIFSDYIKINETFIANKLSLKRETVIEILKALHKFGVISYIAPKNKPQLVFLQERADKKDVFISNEKYSLLKKRAEERIKVVEDYIKNEKKCRSIVLVTYFNQDEPSRCGICDICLNRNKVVLSEYEFDAIVVLLKPLLINNELSMQEIINKTKSIPEINLINAIKWLTDNNKISFNNNNNSYKWNV